jgi:hypothetical protein
MAVVNALIEVHRAGGNALFPDRAKNLLRVAGGGVVHPVVIKR